MHLLRAATQVQWASIFTWIWHSCTASGSDLCAVRKRQWNVKDVWGCLKEECKSPSPCRHLSPLKSKMGLLALGTGKVFSQFNICLCIFITLPTRFFCDGQYINIPFLWIHNGIFFQGCPHWHKHPLVLKDEHLKNFFQIWQSQVSTQRKCPLQTSLFHYIWNMWPHGWTDFMISCMTYNCKAFILFMLCTKCQTCSKLIYSKKKNHNNLDLKRNYMLKCWFKHSLQPASCNDILNIKSLFVVWGHWIFFRDVKLQHWISVVDISPVNI